ncbi:MAG TPA: carboxypeptidase regulatory-like domain-containing protein [Bacteroidia bacterium]|nr:carboxypeptidase regulatory-like domain-containing protein [Bacteroidia bacterium]
MKNFYLTLLILYSALFSFGQENITQKIRGTVVEKETHSEIVGAVVSVISGTNNIVATTDAKGSFRLEGLPIGRHMLKITYVGYHDVILPSVMLNSGKETILTIEMTEAITKMEDVTVTATKKGDANNDMTSVSARNFSMEEANRYAGSRGDPARMAANLAGANSADDSRNDIIIRGNSPAGVLWRVDGITIPNPNHYATPGTTGGPVSILNNKVFGNSDFMTGAFPAEYGNTNAGVFDIKLRNGNNERHEGTVQIGVLGAEIAAEGPLSKKSGATYMFTYRYSTLKVFESLGIPIGTSAVPNYQDASFKLNFPTKRAGNFALFGIGGTSDVLVQLSTLPYNQVELYGDNNRDQYLKSTMGVLGFTHSKSINEKTLIKTTLSAYGQRVTAEDNIFYRDLHADKIDTIFPKLRSKLTSNRYAINSSLTHKYSARVTLKAGVIAECYVYHYNDSNKIQATNVWDIRENYVGNTFLIQPYAQVKYKPTEELAINGGLHAQYLTLNGSYAVEPRLGARWNFKPSQCLSFGYGMHSQMQPDYIYYHQILNSTTGQYQLLDKNLGFTRAQHFVLGYEKRIKQSSRIIVETYYQMLYDVPVDTFKSSYSQLNQGTTFDPTYPGKLVNKGTGANYGIEFTLERYFAKQFFFLFTASLYQSKYKGSDGVLRNTDYNGNYITNLLAGKEFKVGHTGRKVIIVSGKITYSGGRRYSPADINASAAAGSIVAIDSLRNTLRFPNYFRCDLKLGYRVSTKHFTHEVAFDLVNIFNTKNVLAMTYAPDPNNPTANPIKPEYQLGFLPLFYYRVDF